MKRQSHNLSTSDLADRLAIDLYKIVGPIVKRADGGELFAEAVTARKNDFAANTSIKFCTLVY
jgi:hypothetical protein